MKHSCGGRETGEAAECSTCYVALLNQQMGTKVKPAITAVSTLLKTPKITHYKRGTKKQMTYDIILLIHQSHQSLNFKPNNLLVPICSELLTNL